MTKQAWVDLAIVAVLLAIGGAVGWTVNGWRFDAKLNAEISKTAKEGTARANDYLNQLRTAMAEKQLLAADLAKADKRFTDEQKEKQNEIDRLNTCVRTGKCGLRVHAECPKPATDGVLPAPGPGSGVDTATAPRLDPDAERDYFALRKAMTLQYAQLGACVNALGRITGQSRP